MFIQLAFGCELILDHGWAPAQILLEKHLDVAVYSTPPEHAVLLAEAKTDARDIDYVMAVFMELSDDPTSHSEPPPKTKEENAVNKYRTLQREQPDIYVEVAPGLRRAWELSYSLDHPASVAFTTTKDIPRGDAA